MPESPYDAGRIEGKLDIVIENQRKAHDEIQVLGSRLEALEQHKADRSEIHELSERLNSIESFKSRVMGAVAAVSLFIGTVATWITKKTNGA